MAAAPSSSPIATGTTKAWREPSRSADAGRARVARWPLGEDGCTAPPGAAWCGSRLLLEERRDGLRSLAVAWCSSAIHAAAGDSSALLGLTDAAAEDRSALLGPTDAGGCDVRGGGAAYRSPPEPRAWPGPRQERGAGAMRAETRQMGGVAGIGSLPQLANVNDARDGTRDWQAAAACAVGAGAPHGAGLSCSWRDADLSGNRHSKARGRPCARRVAARVGASLRGAPASAPSDAATLSCAAAELPAACNTCEVAIAQVRC
eukprot:358472-Chlamydomonas_euryale.AAC.3